MSATPTRRRAAGDREVVMKHTTTPWVATRFNRPDGSPIETVEHVAETTAASAFHSDKAELWGLTADGSDPSGAPVIAYTGNGPTSRENAHAIARAVNSHADLVNALADVVGTTLGAQGSYPGLSKERTEEILLLLLRQGIAVEAHRRVWSIPIPDGLVAVVRTAGGYLSLAEWKAARERARA
jgi:hypothetical protein